MTITATPFDEVFIIEPTIWHDERGYFYESYNHQKAVENGIRYEWVQDNEAKSTKGVLRGLHYQLPPYAQAKLVRVIQGEVLDVIVDLRPDSKTYGQHLSVILSGRNFKQMIVPRGFAHGYVVLSNEATFAYKCDNYYSKHHEAGLFYADETLAINWILQPDQHIISAKDSILPMFGEHKPYITT